MNVVYEQQSWEGEIIDGKGYRQGQGRGEALQAIPRTMQVVLGGRIPSYRPGGWWRAGGHRRRQSVRVEALALAITYIPPQGVLR